MQTYPFLSDEWMDAARAIREEYRGKTPPVPHSVRMNQVVTEVPFGEGRIEAHLDTSSGEAELELGHLDDPDLTVTLDYETAKSILVEARPEIGMQAFMAGRIRVEGDMTKLMLLQQAQAASPPDPTVIELAGRIQAITE